MENEILKFTLSIEEYRKWLEDLIKAVKKIPDDKLITVSFLKLEEGMEYYAFNMKTKIHEDIDYEDNEKGKIINEK